MNRFLPLLIVSLFIWFACETKHNSIKETLYKNTIANNASSLDLDLIQAEELFSLGRPHQAIDSINLLIAKKPNWAEPYLIKGNIYMKAGQYDQAELSFKKLLNINPQYLSVRFRLGNIAYRKKQFRKAVHYYNKELESGIIKSVDKQITMLQIGRCYLHLGKIDSALITYNKCMEIDSLYGEALGDMARLHIDNGEYKKALRYAKKALSSNQNNIEYLYSLGTIFLKIQKYNLANKYLNLVIDQNPFYEGAYYNLGQASIRLGNNSLGNKYLAMADSVQKLYTKMENLELALDKEPGNYRNWLALIKLYESAGMKRKAEQALFASQFTKSLKN